MRWLVGDLQGCARALERLLKKVRFDPKHDELWCCGDLINRGPDSLETLRIFNDVGGHAVLGNHEVYAISYFDGYWPRKDDTLDALFDADDADQLIGQLRELPLLAKLPARGAEVGEVWVVHGGLHPTWSNLKKTAARINEGKRDQGWFESPDTKFATRVRCCDEGGAMSKHHGPPDECPKGYAPWDEMRAPGPWVVHGHWAWRGHYCNPEAKVMGLDSGAVYGGPLTAWCMEEDRVVQVRGEA